MSVDMDLFKDLPDLRTERLLLRKLSMDDAPDLFAYAADPEVTRYLDWEPHSSIDDSRRFLEGVTEAYARGEPRSWAIVYRDEDRMIGTGGFLFWDQVANRSEIGYATSRQYWGRGLMSEAVPEMLRFGFERMALNRIEARCNRSNTGSIRVLEKSGFKLEGVLRESFVQKGKLSDLLLFSILRREWSDG
jgi:[ribosomal protein S5]-alanine N-acetyltransferase